MDTFGVYTFKVRSYECDSEGFAQLSTVCTYLQEAASMNAEDLKFSKLNFEAAGENISWVLTRQVVKMLRYPHWNDEVVVTTFPRGGRKITAFRDFLITSPSGEEYGRASSEWMLIDLATRKIVAIPQSVFDLANTERDPVLGLEPFTSRLRFPAGDASEPLAFRAQKSQIDLNGHVNNVHYVEWLLEPLENRRPQLMEVIYRSETLAGDEVRVAIQKEADGTVFHRVFSADGKDHVVARTQEKAS